MGTTETTPIVLLPGMDGTGELLKDLADRLARHRPVQVLAYPLDEPLNYSQLTAYVVERAPNRPFVILGESFSGPIAIEIAATDPRVAGLILASSFARHPLPALLAALTRLIDPNWLPRRVVAATLMGSTSTPELADRLNKVLADLPREILQFRAREALRVNKRHRLSETKCPVLCLHGRLDRLVTRKQVNEIVAAQPRCEVQWLDSSHMLLATHSEAAAAAIDQFCAQIDK
jgi:pimeloyl-ACP methyl ester carboxylesterase